MAMVNLRDYQLEAVMRMKNGCILCGGVGSGKSRTSLAYYYLRNGGKVTTAIRPEYEMMKNPKDLYIITTPKKRDSKEWESEMLPFYISPNKSISVYNHNVVVDSWNNIKKYITVKDAFFIFDEQRVIGNGTWVKSFLQIAKSNEWILLSATPGDTWSDYIPVFLANGFYKNRTEFTREHIVYSRFCRYAKIERYLGENKLARLRDSILVPMRYKKDTKLHYENVFVNYDIQTYKNLNKSRWNIFENKPIETASEFCYVLRKIVNSDQSRIDALIDICKRVQKVIVFYNFTYELEQIKSALEDINFPYAEWNGFHHNPIPDGDRWVYIVQYTAGAEGWNCIQTDTTVFYSLNYSYKVIMQSCGRIDRMNTPYTDLYYYFLRSRSGIDLAISNAVKQKKKFNEQSFYEKE